MPRRMAGRFSKGIIFIRKRLQRFCGYFARGHSCHDRFFSGRQSVRHLDAALVHQRIPVRIRGGVEYDNRQEFSGRMSLRYEQAMSFPIFYRENNPNAQQWSIDYSGITSVYGFDGEVSYQPTDDDELFGNLKINISSNSERRGHIPYMPDFEAGALYRRRFPFRLEASVLLQWIGERVAEAATLPSVLLLSSRRNIVSINISGFSLR